LLTTSNHICMGDGEFRISFQVNLHVVLCRNTDRFVPVPNTVVKGSIMTLLYLVFS
jgi:hypothetical protein